MTSVFIGMPVFNGMPFLSEAIESIRNQTHTDWTLLISDNASDDTTQDVCENYVKIDSRIHYVRQKQNLGALGNFDFVLKQADKELFMWAAADDIWDKDFLSVNISSLEQKNDIGLAFCNIINIDSFGRVIREYPSFDIFSDANRKNTIISYLESPEFFGKANLIYGIYRVDLCRRAWKVAFPSLADQWGSDMCFILGVLARGGACIDRRVLFKKRVVRQTDTPDHADIIFGRNPGNYSFDVLESFTRKEKIAYVKNNLKVVKGTPYYWITVKVFFMRLLKLYLYSA